MKKLRQGVKSLKFGVFEENETLTGDSNVVTGTHHQGICIKMCAWLSYLVLWNWLGVPKIVQPTRHPLDNEAPPEFKKLIQEKCKLQLVQWPHMRQQPERKYGQNIG